MKKQTVLAWLLGGGIALGFPEVLARLLAWRVQKKSPYETGDKIETPWGAVHYVESGHGKPLVLVHAPGLGESHLAWERNQEALSEHFRVYALDLPGFGWSEARPLPYTAYAYAQILCTFVRQAIGRPAAVAAMGDGAVAAAIACRLDPGVFRRLVLVNPGGLSGAGSDNFLARQRRWWTLPGPGILAYLLQARREALEERLRRELLADQSRRGDAVEALYTGALVGGPNARYGAASAQARFTCLDLRPQLKALTLPTYAIFGQTHQEDLEVFRQCKPNAAFYVFENTAGWPQWENPGAFNRTLTEILQSPLHAR